MQLNKTLSVHRAVRGWWHLSKLKVLHMPLSCPSAAQPAQKQSMFWKGTLMQNCTGRWKQHCTLLLERKAIRTAPLTVWTKLRSALTSSMCLASTAVPPFGNYCSESLNAAHSVLQAESGGRGCSIQLSTSPEGCSGFGWVSWLLLICILLVSTSINLLSSANKSVRSLPFSCFQSHQIRNTS